MAHWLRFFIVLLWLFGGTTAGAELRDPADHFFHPFLGDMPGELAEAKASGRKGLFVMYHFEECPSCTRMKKQVLNRSDVQDWYRREFTVIGIDTLGAQPITGLDGRVLPENEYARARQIRATPTFDFYDLDGKHAYRHVRGIFDPAEFMLLGAFLVEGAYRGQTFQEYKQKFMIKGR